MLPNENYTKAVLKMGRQYSNFGNTGQNVCRKNKTACFFSHASRGGTANYIILPLAIVMLIMALLPQRKKQQ